MRRKVYDTNSDNVASAELQTAHEKQIKKLHARITEMEDELRVLSQVPVGEVDQSKGAALMDIRWHCKKCNYLLAFYDKDHDVMRTRYKEHIVYMRAGVGGFIQIVCRGCSEVNTQEYVSADESEDMG